MSGRTKRILRRFKLNEISFVDSPAQEHATIAITKRKDDTMTTPQTIEQAIDLIEVEMRSRLIAKQAIGDVDERDEWVRTQAMAQARARYPALFAEFCSRPAPSVEPVQKVKPSDAELEFDRLVDEVRNRDKKLTHTAAMSKAREQYPGEFAKAYGSR